MCVVSISEFYNNPAKYFQIAKTEQVLIEDDGQTFELVKKDVFISGEELAKGVHEHIEKMFEDRKQVITEEDLANSYSVNEFKAVMKEEIHQIFNR